jgi:hypothetical protein
VTEPYIPTGAARHDFATLVQILGAATFNFVGSNSAANLSSNPCRRVICDEVDKFDQGSDREASALNLAEQRTKGQVNPQRWKTSTPTLDSGLIWAEYLKGDQRRYFVPCPHCKGEVLLAWSSEMSLMPNIGCEAYVKWSAEAKNAGEWDLDKVAETAHALCPHCKGKILDEHKPQMLKDGQWKATADSAVAGFRSRHLPSLYSTLPECRFGSMAVKFLQAKRSVFGLQGFINGDLAEPFVDQDRAKTRTELVKERAELVSEDTPRLMTVDCQAKSPHFWYVVRSWKGNQSEGTIAGSCDTWEELREIQIKAKVQDCGVLVDSGFGARSDADVYINCSRFCQCNPQRELFGWMPSKGFAARKKWRDRESGNMNPFYVSSVDPFLGTTDSGQVKMPLLEFSSDYFKDILAKLRESQDDFKWSITKSAATEEYWRHMDGEVKRFMFSKMSGRSKYEWSRRSTRWPNHLLDCEVMQLAFACFLGAFNPVEQKDER